MAPEILAVRATRPSRVASLIGLAWCIAMLAWTLWRWLVPFWRYRDVNQGTAEQRYANWQYNREQRGHLVPCLFRWILVAAGCMLLLRGLEAWVAQMAVGFLRTLVFALAVGAGIGFSVAIPIFFVLLVAWIWLGRENG